MNYFEIFSFSLTQSSTWWGLGFVLWLVCFLVLSKSFGFWSWSQQSSIHLVKSKTQKKELPKLDPYNGSFPKLHSAFCASFDPKHWFYFWVFLIGSLFVAVAFGQALFLTVGFWGVIILLMLYKHYKLRQKIVEQCPFFLRVLSRSMQAGYNFEQGLEFVTKEIDEPLKKELHIIRRDLNYYSLEESLMKFAKRIEDSEVLFMAQSIGLQIETGSNIVEFLGKLSLMMEEKLKLQRDLKSFTSQGRMSALIVAGLWPLSLLVFWLFSPDHISILFDTSVGNMLIVISLILEIVGFFFVWKITTVKL